MPGRVSEADPDRGSTRPSLLTKDLIPVLYTILVIIAAIVLAVIVLNVLRSGGRTI